MIIDGRSKETAPQASYDILVVGGGPAGITIARELDGTGLSVALLESGGREFDGETQGLNDGPVSGLDEVDLSAIRLRFLGGTSHHWGGFCLPLDPIDFERRPLNGMSGWPFGHRELRDVYARANRILDIGTFDYDLDTIEGISRDDLLLPGNDVVETTVMRLSSNPPTNFSEKYTAMLAASDNVETWLWSNVTGLNFTPDGNVEAVETQTLSGETRSFRATRVVIACGAVENARLLMASNTVNETSFGDASGLLGACYMDHPAGGAAFLWPERLLGPKAYWNDEILTRDGTRAHLLWRLKDEVLEQEGLANAQFYLIPFSVDDEERIRGREAKRGLRGLKEIAKWSIGRGRHDFSLSESYCDFITNADAMVADAVFPQTGDVDRVLLKYETEQQPERTSRITLAEDIDAFGQPRAALHWSPTEDDRDSVVRTAQLFGEAVGKAGLGRIELEEGYEERYWNMVTSWHQLGTTRMSAAASDGVVDTDCRVHGTTNLYIAGGSVFPTSGRANPTLTIVALALRLADHLKDTA